MTRKLERVLVIKMFYPMVKALSAQGLNVTVLGFESGVEAQAEAEILRSLPGNVKFVPLEFKRNSRGLGNFKLIGKFAALIRQERPDVIHVNALQDLVLANLAARWALPFQKRPAITVMTHNPEIWSRLKQARLAAVAIRLFADGFVALASTNKDQVTRMGFPEKKVIVIPNPFDPGQVQSQPAARKETSKTQADPVRVIYIANVCQRKAQDVLVRAAAQVLQKHPHVVFDLLGKEMNGEEAYIEGLHRCARDLKIEENIHFHGLVPFQEAMRRLDESDIFVFPTLSEMMPRAVIEAMIAGKPIIASAVDGILDLVHDQATGLLVKPGDETQLANAINELIENPALAKRLGAASRDYVMNFCSPERVGTLFQEFYQSLLN